MGALRSEICQLRFTFMAAAYQVFHAYGMRTKKGNQGPSFEKLYPSAAVDKMVAAMLAAEPDIEKPQPVRPARPTGKGNIHLLKSLLPK